MPLFQLFSLVLDFALFFFVFTFKRFTELKRTTAFSDELLMYLLHIFLRPEDFVQMDVVDSLLDGEKLLQDYMLTYKNFTVESFVKEARFCFRNLVVEK